MTYLEANSIVKVNKKIFKDDNYLIVKHKDSFLIFSQDDYLIMWDHKEAKLKTYSNEYLLYSGNLEINPDNIVGAIRYDELHFKQNISENEKQLAIQFVQNLILPGSN